MTARKLDDKKGQDLYKKTMNFVNDAMKKYSDMKRFIGICIVCFFWTPNKTVLPVSNTVKSWVQGQDNFYFSSRDNYRRINYLFGWNIGMSSDNKEYWNSVRTNNRILTNAN